MVETDLASCMITLPPQLEESARLAQAVREQLERING
jgi:hypothetical protein